MFAGQYAWLGPPPLSDVKCRTCKSPEPELDAEIWQVKLESKQQIIWHELSLKFYYPFLHLNSGNTHSLGIDIHGAGFSPALSLNSPNLQTKKIARPLRIPAWHFPMK
jgi:hypothetical protein